MIESKLVYKDGEKVKIIKGFIISEDDFLINISESNKQWRIGKASIISIMQSEQNENSQKTKNT